MVRRHKHIKWLVLSALLMTPAGGFSQETLEPTQLLDFGANWTFREGTVRTTQWPIALDGAPAPEEGWFEGAAPFTARSAAQHTEIAQTRRQINRRRRRAGRSPLDPQPGTIVVYDPADFSRPAGAQPDYEPGPNTYLFVTEFEVTDPRSITSLLFEAKFSAGFVAYLNGREWLRHNVRPGQLRSAPADVVWQPEWVRQTVANHWQRAYTGLDPARLRPGLNTLAVEVHRRAGGGERALFLDAQLKAFSDVGFVKTPYLLSVRPDGVSVSWEASVAGVGYVEFGSGERLERLASRPQIESTLQEVRLAGLTPDTRYFYRVNTAYRDAEGREQTLSGPIQHFRTALPPGDDAPFSVMVYGDNRTNTEIHGRLVNRMLASAESEGARFIVNTGDLTTHGGSWDEWQDEFFEPALPMLGRFPLYPALGNHEGNHESWYEYFDLPNNESWYQFRYGEVDFFALNTSASLAPGSTQLEWLDSALAASDARWKVAYFHHPPFSCVPTRKPGHTAVRENAVPLFEQYGVDLVLLGHDHLYGRSVPVNGVVYVISGGGGAGTYPAEPDEINEVCVQIHHYCILRVGRDALQLEAITIDGELLDTFTLTGNHDELR